MIVLISRDFRRQFCSMLPGALIMFIMGLWSSWGAFNPNNKLNNDSILEMFLSVISFYFGIIPGSVLGAYCLYRFHILKTNHATITALIILAILYMTLPKRMEYLVVTRLFVGVFCGMNHLLFVNYGAEITTPKTRARIIFLLQLWFNLGLFAVAWIDFHIVHYVVGGLTTIMAFWSGFLGYHKLNRSPVYSALKNDIGSTAKSLDYYQRDIPRLFEVAQYMKKQLDDVYLRPLYLFGLQNLRTTILILLVMLGKTLISNYLMLDIRNAVVYKELGELGYDGHLSMGLLIGVRLIGGIIGYCLLDLKPRGYWYKLTGTLITMAMLSISIIQVFTVPKIVTPLLCVTIEFLFGIGMIALPDILSAEILPMKEKKFSMSFLQSFEALSQITFTFLAYQNFTQDSVDGRIKDHFTIGMILFGILIITVSKLTNSETKTIFEAPDLYK